MAENLAKRPAKGILKASSSFDHVESNKNVPTDIKWDEMNILQTLHPPDKDYGHMKIDEPKTPYSYYNDGTEVSGHGDDVLDANLLAEKISLSSEEAPKSLINANSSDDEDEEETEEEREQRKAFEYKRKMHYDEYYAVKLARKLMAKDVEDDDEEEEVEEEKNGPEEENSENEENYEDTIEDKK